MRRKCKKHSNSTDNQISDTLNKRLLFFLNFLFGNPFFLLFI